jgi:predicted SprT family Zn-dependent metalloprotease
MGIKLTEKVKSLRMTEEVQHFIKTVKYQCKCLGIEFSLSRAKSVYTKDGYSCAGFFLPPDKKKRGKIRVATGKLSIDDWIFTLAHEYAHLLQWFERDPLFELHDKNEEFYIRLERKTEKKAMQILRKFKIPVTKKQKKISESYLRRLSKGF